MNSGGEPERDDTGLPPVDIEVPDDARELDRDVQAYRREQRAVRRHLRSRRLRRLLARDGMAVPLLVGCLIFALVAGTLLTLFTATSINPNLPGQQSTASPPTGTHRTPAPARSSPATHSPAAQRLSGTASAAARATSSGAAGTSPKAGSSAKAGGSVKAGTPVRPGASAMPRSSTRAGASAGAGSAATGLSHPRSVAPPVAAVTKAPSQVSEATVVVDGVWVPVRSLRPAVLLMVPAGCACETAINQLASLTLALGAHAFLVINPDAVSQSINIVRELDSGITPAEDMHHSLSSFPIVGLTAVIVSVNGSVFYAERLQASTNLAAVLEAAHI